MFVVDGEMMCSPSDLTSFVQCEFAWLRHVDASLGRVGRCAPSDLMAERIAKMGSAHEKRVHARLLDQYGRYDETRGVGVFDVDLSFWHTAAASAGGLDAHDPATDGAQPRAAAVVDGIRQAAEQTAQVLRAGADVVYQATFLSPGFVGFADFLIRGDDGRWAVYDTKLARRETVSALLQIAAYTDALVRSGVPVSSAGHVLLGDGRDVGYPMGETIAVYRRAWARLRAVVQDRQRSADVLEWTDGRYEGCGACAVCTGEVAANRDLYLVANMRASQRKALLAAGINTIDALAGYDGQVDGVPARTMASMVAQARLQVRQSRPRQGQSAQGQPVQGQPVQYEVFDSARLGLIPPPDPGDIFFDFEGDPLYVGDDPRESGLEYLFGVVELPSRGGLPAERPGAALSSTALSSAKRPDAGRPNTAPSSAAQSSDKRPHTAFAGAKIPSSDLVFRPFWAHSRTQERQALIDFLDYVSARRAAYPNMHIYHYAAYEKSALLRLAGRYGVGEGVVDQLLRDDVLVDLYTVVRGAVRISQPSYSIKKLEPLYMGAELRSGDVTTAGDSIVWYAQYCDQRDAGETDLAEATLAQIADYNRYDCVSTLRLRDWLLDRAQECGIRRHTLGASGECKPDSGSNADSDSDTGIDANADSGGDAGSDSSAHSEGDASTEAVAERSVVDAPESEADEAFLLAADLTHEFAEVPRIDRTPAQQARALLAASLGYHAREDKPFWWAHFDRLTSPIDEWADTAGVLVIDKATVTAEWAKSSRQRTAHRTIDVTGHTDGGKAIATQVLALYDFGADVGAAAPDISDADSGLGMRAYTKATVKARADRYARADSDAGVDHGARGDNAAGVVTIDERAPSDAPGPSTLPVALAPASPVGTATVHDAVIEIARAAVAAGSESGSAGYLAGSAIGSNDAAADDGHGSRLRPAIMQLLRREPPRVAGKQQIPACDGPPDVDLLVTAVANLDDSYLAVQGPPGSGKTFIGSQVVRRLVADRRWRIGVVAQSHRVVENFLDAVASAGLPTAQIGKKPQSGAKVPDTCAWTPLTTDKTFASWIGDHAEEGYVVGGTAWDLVNTKRIERESLDLLVIDEAGQFSLANTIAVSVAARNLLLLGDPQQLPQVSQGSHPEPCDESALSWVVGDHAVMPSDRGYFLSRTWRMHPVLANAISQLAYDGMLSAREDVTGQRYLAGVAPGVGVVDVVHHGNATVAPEEAVAIVHQVRELIGRTWIAPDKHRGQRPLDQHDILVVAPYNAQVAHLTTALAQAGYGDIRVGTVDKFQGQEAPIVMVSMTASAASDVPRGMDFLLSRNRINVAVSRAQWRAIVFRSPALIDHIPTNPAALAELGGFIRMCET